MHALVHTHSNIFNFSLHPGHTLDSCIKADNPSTSNKKCIQFKAAMGADKMPTKGNTVLIMYGKKKRKTICYPEDPCAATRGWCGTCLRNAKYGEYGFCQVGILVCESGPAAN